MAFLYDYMTESELELAKEEKEFEMESTRIMNAMTAIEMKHELDVKQIESQAMFESYTDDQLTEEYEKEYLLYMEATDSVWAKFKAFVKGILDKILGRKSGDVPSDMSDTEVTLEDNPSKIREILDKVAGVFKNTNGDLDLLKVTIAGIGTVTGVKLLKDKLTERKAEKTKIKAGQLSSEISKTEKSVKNLSDSIPEDPKDNSFKSTLIGIGNFVVGLGQKLINSMKNIVTKITGHQFKSQEGENAGANGETNDNAKATDSSKEGEKPADNAEGKPAENGDNANQQGKPAEKKNDNESKKIHAGESQSSVSGGKYKIDWNKVTKVDDVKVPLDDILDYGKKEEVLKQLSKTYFINTSSSHSGVAQSIKASDITLDNIGTKGLSAIVSLAKSNGAEGIQEWGKVVTALNKLGLYKDTKLKDLGDFKGKYAADKAIEKEDRNTPDISEEGLVRAVLSKSVNKEDAYKRYKKSVKDALNTLTPNSAKVPADTKTFNSLVNMVKSSLTDEEKKHIVEDFIKYYPDVYNDNREKVDAIAQSMGVDLLSTSGTDVDKHDDTIEKNMVAFANKNHVILFDDKAPGGMNTADFRSKKNKMSGWKGDYCFDPTTLPTTTRFEVMKRAADNIFKEKIDKKVVANNKAEFTKFAQYLKKLTKYTLNGAGRDRLPKDSYLKDLGIKLESTYESIDFDEFENILVTESEIDMLFESTTSEIVAEINDILESTFMSTK